MIKRNGPSKTSKKSELPQYNEGLGGTSVPTTKFTAEDSAPSATVGQPFTKFEASSSDSLNVGSKIDKNLQTKVRDSKFKYVRKKFRDLPASALPLRRIESHFCFLRSDRYSRYIGNISFLTQTPAFIVKKCGGNVLVGTNRKSVYVYPIPSLMNFLTNDFERRENPFRPGYLKINSKVIKSNGKNLTLQTGKLDQIDDFLEPSSPKFVNSPTLKPF